MQKSNLELKSKLMKKSRQLIISSIVAITGVSLAGSVTGTVAWFQYATNATVAYTGTTAHCSELLSISVDGGTNWRSDIKSSELPQDIKFAPITTGAQAKDEALATTIIGSGASSKEITRFYSAPAYRQGLYENWLIAGENNYSQFTVLVKLADVDENFGTDDQTYLEKDVYLTDLTITNADEYDIDHGIRVHYDAESPDGSHKYFLFSKGSETTNVGGCLDLNVDGVLDSENYEWSDVCVYGGSDGDPVIDEDGVLTNPLVQTSYLADDTSVIANDANGVITGGTSFGKTGTAEGEYLKITVTIWLEGWSKLDIGVDSSYHEGESAIWDSATYANKSFNVGMTFGVSLHSDADHE